MTYEGLWDLFEIDFSVTCGGEIRLVFMGRRTTPSKRKRFKNNIWCLNKALKSFSRKFIKLKFNSKSACRAENF